MNRPYKTSKEIKKLHIQGAKAIAVASLLCLKGLANSHCGSIRQFIDRQKKAIRQLQSARPTEPMVYNTLKFLNANLKSYLKTDTIHAKNNYIGIINGFLSQIDLCEEKIISSGIKIIKPGDNILTHCHSSTVENIIKSAGKKIKFKVFSTETRPLFQGRITARNLVKAGIPVTMVADSAGAFIISRLSGENLMMDMVILGADALMPNGSIVNKIGSYGLSLAAKAEGIPLYIACHLLKTDGSGIVPIEIRSEKEIWPNKPDGLKIINFAFDIVPAENITGIICEAGTIKPKEIKKCVKKYYPWIFKKI